MHPAKRLHRQAMEATDRADLCRRHGDADGERRALAEALELELAAIAAMPPAADVSRIVLTESAEAIRCQITTPNHIPDVSED